MTRCLRSLILGIFLFGLGGCEIFTFTGHLLQELIPLAIQYAPYALMFLEAPEGSPDAQWAAAPSERSDKSLPPLHQALREHLARRGEGNVCIVAVEISNREGQREMEEWLERHPGWKVHRVDVYCDFSDDLQFSQVRSVLESYPNARFWGTGPLRALSAPLPESGEHLGEIVRQ